MVKKSFLYHLLKKKIKLLSWPEQPQTINEIGSTFTIQGFDLNYVGVKQNIKEK